MAHQGLPSIDPAVLDDIISRLLDFRQTRAAKHQQVQLTENEIRQLCDVSAEIFLQQPNLLELEAPIKICGTCFYFPFSHLNLLFLFIASLGEISV